MLCNISQNAMGQTLGGGGVPISYNALQHFPECHGADTRGYPARSSQGGTLLGGGPYQGYPAGGGGTLLGGIQIEYPPSQVRMGVPCQEGTPGRVSPQVRMGGYLVRTTEEVLTTWRAVCLLRSRRMTFLLNEIFSAIAAGSNL